MEETGELMDNCPLPQLDALFLVGLPRLTSLNQQNLILGWPSLRIVHVRECPKMKRLCLGPENAPELSHLCGPMEWLQALEEWNDESTREYFLKAYHDCTKGKGVRQPQKQTS